MYGSASVLKTKAEKGSSGVPFRATGLPSLGLFPSKLRVAGDGGRTGFSVGHRVGSGAVSLSR